MSATEVFIFSYNRGQLLQNCVQSAQKYIPNVSITVIDDNSDDPETIKVLNNFDSEVRVLKPNLDDGSRWGGFYNNINWVIQELAESRWVLLIEDDMQYVRPFLKEDYSRINSFFNNNPRSAYLAVEFLKERLREKDQQSLIVDKEQDMYFFKESAEDYRGTIHICSSGVLNIQLMREVGYKFVGDRPEIRARAKKQFTRKGFYPYPLLMYLPSAPSVKNRKSTFTRNLIEYYYKTGFYPYKEMSHRELQQFMNRDISILPYTSDFIETMDKSIKPPYIYADSMRRCHGLFRRIEKVEKKLRGLASQ
ncbi:glycosyltransferase family 2 protein [Balneolaceae bacterium ANBcel3]|nr:glycosyltransferase family 2 protein [Balneolaceae bacterium ANBcel3]